MAAYGLSALSTHLPVHAPVRHKCSNDGQQAKSERDPFSGRLNGWGAHRKARLYYKGVGWSIIYSDVDRSTASESAGGRIV